MQDKKNAFTVNIIRMSMHVGQARQERGYQNPDISAEICSNSCPWLGQCWQRAQSLEEAATEFVKICLPHGYLLFIPEVEPYLENKYSLKGLLSVMSFQRE